MDKEQFRKLFAICFLAGRSLHVARHTGPREEENTNDEALRYADICWDKFCRIWPEKEHDPFWLNKLMAKIHGNPPPSEAEKED